MYSRSMYSRQHVSSCQPPAMKRSIEAVTRAEFPVGMPLQMLTRDLIGQSNPIRMQVRLFLQLHCPWFLALHRPDPFSFWLQYLRYSAHTASFFLLS